MTAPDAWRSMTIEEYLRFDDSSPSRHEYVRGDVYALSGVTLRHDRIARNVLIALSAAAGEGPCEVVSSDVRLRAADDVFYYPDVTVICAPVAELDVIVSDPCVIVEVTSPSTARIDRGEKLMAYREIPSLLAYLIVDHRRRRVERHWRAEAAGEWKREEVVGDGSIPVPCVDVELPLGVFYQRVNLANLAEPEGEEYEV